MIPISLVGVFLLASIVEFLEKKIQTPKLRNGIILILCASVSLFGIWTAFGRDDEGILKNRIELERYAEIRLNAEKLISSDTVIFSDRSDKIFFPAFRVAPISDPNNLTKYLFEKNGPVGYFGRTLDEKVKAEWVDRGVSFEPLLEAGNETLYIAKQI
ncbi:MAG: hypothetical protein NUV81_01020, partial [bacterium]|nr:hypothetical protein [bacterium]